MVDWLELCPTLLYNVASVQWGLRSFIYAQHFSQVYSFPFSCSVGDSLVGFGPSSCCTTQCGPGFSCQISGFTYDFGRGVHVHVQLSDYKVPRSYCCKTSPNHRTYTTVHESHAATFRLSPVDPSTSTSLHTSAPLVESFSNWSVMSLTFNRLTEVCLVRDVVLSFFAVC